MVSGYLGEEGLRKRKRRGKVKRGGEELIKGL